MGFAQYVKQLYNGDAPDIGQVFYVVDSDYRTGDQGWSRADGTGPLDLWGQRNPGYVFRTGDYSSDAACVQDTIDAMVDFRGDILSFTPGSLSLATSLAFNVPNARYLGPPVKNPRRSAVTLIDAIGDHAVSVDNVEFGFLRFVPLTAQNWFSVANGADAGFIHDCFYDAIGIAASTSTEFVRTAATTTDWLIQNTYHLVDAAQGDCYTLVGGARWGWQSSRFQNRGGTWASVFTFVTTASRGCWADDLHFEADGASSVYTNLFTGMTGANMLKVTRSYVNGTSLATATDIETGFDATTGIELSENYQTGDATTQGGVLIVLA